MKVKNMILLRFFLLKKKENQPRPQWVVLSALVYQVGRVEPAWPQVPCEARDAYIPGQAVPKEIRFRPNLAYAPDLRA